MKKNFFKYLVLIGAISVFFAACRKDSYLGTETLGSGNSYVRITEAKVNAQFFAPFTNIKPVTMFSVRRDAANNAELNTPRSVVLTAIPNYVATYNTANGTNYTVLPASIYTVATDPTIVATSTGFSFNFGAGDFAKNLVFNIDGSKVDLSKQYAVAYTISDAGGLTRKIGLDTVIATVAIKNKYDGVYAITGTMVDVTNATLTHINNFLTTGGAALGAPAPMQWELRTTSATTCAVYDNYFYGGYYIAISSGSSYSAYGSFSLIVQFDPATDKIVAVTNYYGQPASNTRSAQLDPSGVNAYANGKIQIKYRMLQPSVVTAPPYIRTTWDETWTFLHSR